jgi:hypothetical protein
MENPVSEESQDCKSQDAIPTTVFRTTEQESIIPIEIHLSQSSYDLPHEVGRCSQLFPVALEENPFRPHKIENKDQINSYLVACIGRSQRGLQSCDSISDDIGGSTQEMRNEDFHSKKLDPGAFSVHSDLEVCHKSRS